RADIVARPLLERRHSVFAHRDGREVELADGGEAACEMLERRRPDQIAAGGDRALGEDDRLAHAVHSRSRVRVTANAASAIPMPSIATSRGVAVRVGTNDWCHSSEAA